MHTKNRNKCYFWYWNWICVCSSTGGACDAWLHGEEVNRNNRNIRNRFAILLRTRAIIPAIWYLIFGFWFAFTRDDRMNNNNNNTNNSIRDQWHTNEIIYQNIFRTRRFHIMDSDGSNATSYTSKWFNIPAFFSLALFRRFHTHFYFISMRSNLLAKHFSLKKIIYFDLSLTPYQFHSRNPILFVGSMRLACNIVYMRVTFGILHCQLQYLLLHNTSILIHQLKSIHLQERQYGMHKHMLWHRMNQRRREEKTKDRNKFGV